MRSRYLSHAVVQLLIACALPTVVSAATAPRAYVFRNAADPFLAQLTTLETRPAEDQQKILDQLATYGKTTELRFISRARDVVDVYCVFPSDTSCLFSFTEKERKSRIAVDLKTLFEGIVKGAGLRAASGKTYSVTQASYRLKEDRATLEVRAGALDPKDAVIAEEQAQDEDQRRIAVVVDMRDAGPKEIAKTTIITGPGEPWFLTANILANKVTAFKFDSTTRTLVEREKPDKFHVGVNYSFGDVALPPSNLRDAVFATLLFSGSSRPLESYGVGLGLRGAKVGDYVDLSAITIFGAYTWTESDEVDAAGAPKIGSARKGEARFGVGFNLSKVLDWMK